MDARSVVAVILALTICAAILAPITARLFRLKGNEQQLSDTVVSGLTDLLKVGMGALVGWLAAN